MKAEIPNKPLWAEIAAVWQVGACISKHASGVHFCSDQITSGSGGLDRVWGPSTNLAAEHIQPEGLKAEGTQLTCMGSGAEEVGESQTLWVYGVM